MTGSFMKLLYTKVRLISAFLLIAAILGCAAHHKVPYANLVTKQVKIVATDKSFTITSGNRFTIPYYAKCNSFNAYDGNLSEKFDVALRKGARHVTVFGPGNKQYYGIMSFCYLSEGASGPGSRSYEIDIAKNYFDAAVGGRISVVYEQVENKKAKYGKEKGWILWLSDQPMVKGSAK